MYKTVHENCLPCSSISPNMIFFLFSSLCFSSSIPLHILLFSPYPSFFNSLHNILFLFSYSPLLSSTFPPFFLLFPLSSFSLILQLFPPFCFSWFSGVEKGMIDDLFLPSTPERKKDWRQRGVATSFFFTLFLSLYPPFFCPEPFFFTILSAYCILTLSISYISHKFFSLPFPFCLVNLSSTFLDASSHLYIRSFVRMSVCPSVCYLWPLLDASIFPPGLDYLLLVINLYSLHFLPL